MREDPVFEAELGKQRKDTPWGEMGVFSTSVLQTYVRFTASTDLLSFLSDLFAIPSSGALSGLSRIEIVQYDDSGFDILIEVACYDDRNSLASDLGYALRVYEYSTRYETAPVDWEKRSACVELATITDLRVIDGDADVSLARLLAWDGTHYASPTCVGSCFGYKNAASVVLTLRRLLWMDFRGRNRLRISVGRSGLERCWHVNVYVGRGALINSDIEAAKFLDRELGCFRRNVERVYDLVGSRAYRIPMNLDRGRHIIGECWNAKYLYLTDELRNDLAYVRKQSEFKETWNVRLAVRSQELGGVWMSRGLERVVNSGGLSVVALDGGALEVDGCPREYSSVGISNGDPDQEYVEDMLPISMQLVKSNRSYVTDIQCSENKNYVRFLTLFSATLDEARNRLAKLSVINTLAIDGQEQCHPVLLRALKEVRPGGRYEGMQWELINALEATATDAIADALIAIARDRRLGPDRQMAVFGLGKLNDARVVDVLIDLLKDDEVVIAALMALGRNYMQANYRVRPIARTTDKKALPYVERFLYHQNPYVRRIAKRAVERILGKGPPISQPPFFRPVPAPASADIPLPPGLAEFSIACSADHVEHILEPLSRLVSSGFGPDEIEQVLSAIYYDEEWRKAEFEFSVIYRERETPLHMKVHLYYGAPELYVYSGPELIAEYEPEVVKVIEFIEFMNEPSSGE